MSTKLDAVIAGGGPAGCALAILLAQQGRTVELIEKSTHADNKVCGEFYSNETVQYLKFLGIDLHSMGALPIASVRLARKRVIAECELPFLGLSLPRRIVDEALLERAYAVEARLIRGKNVEALQHREDAWVFRCSDGSEHTATEAFIATGKHDLRGWKRDSGKQNDLVAFKMYFALSSTQGDALKHCVELILFPGGYAGLQLVEPGVANLSLLIRRTIFHKCGAGWPAVLAHVKTHSPHLCDRLTGAMALLEKPLALSSIPYGYHRSTKGIAPWCLGDQCAVVPSFTGDGMAIALHSAHVAAGYFLSGHTSSDFHAEFRRQMRAPIQTADFFSRLMMEVPMLTYGLRIYPETMAWITRRTRIPEQFCTASWM
ncbi:MAG: FAD-dependent monooxygenase [Acidobacteria bacterium]|nr:FAD-dependent monooxygenase [Acidobacteriota bacterium]